MSSKAPDDFVPQEDETFDYGTDYEPLKAADATEGLGELVGLIVGVPRHREVGRAETAQEQREEQIQDLQ